MKNIDKIIVSSQTARDSILALIRVAQQKDSKKTISWLSKRIGLQSRSNLSEALRGKRPLKFQHWRSLLRVLKLNEAQQEFIVTKLELETATTQSSTAYLKEKLALLKVFLEGPLKLISANFENGIFEHEVLASFALYDQKPSQQDLRQHFGRDKYRQIDKALVNLEKLGLIAKKGNHYQKSATHEDKMLKFHNLSNQQSEIDFIKEAMDRAKLDIDKWYSNSELSFFGTSFVAVREDEFRQALQEFKKSLIKKTLELESGSADMVVNLNMQIYPIRTTKT